eukprot:Stramenopile-MAST_4_protein_2147
MLKNKEVIRLREELAATHEELKNATEKNTKLEAYNLQLKKSMKELTDYIEELEESISKHEKSAPSPKREEVTQNLVETWALDRIRWLVKGYLARKAYKIRLIELCAFDFGDFESKYNLSSHEEESADVSNLSDASVSSSETNHANHHEAGTGFTTPVRNSRLKQHAPERDAETAGMCNSHSSSPRDTGENVSPCDRDTVHPSEHANEQVVTTVKENSAAAEHRSNRPKKVSEEPSFAAEQFSPSAESNVQSRTGAVATIEHNQPPVRKTSFSDGTIKKENENSTKSSEARQRQYEEASAPLSVSVEPCHQKEKNDVPQDDLSFLNDSSSDEENDVTISSLGQQHIAIGEGFNTELEHVFANGVGSGIEHDENELFEAENSVVESDSCGDSDIAGDGSSLSSLSAGSDVDNLPVLLSSDEDSISDISSKDE